MMYDVSMMQAWWKPHVNTCETEQSVFIHKLADSLFITFPAKFLLFIKYFQFILSCVKSLYANFSNFLRLK